MRKNDEIILDGVEPDISDVESLEDIKGIQAPDLER